ncbi:metallophosphoesterase [Desulfonatronospira thiodismutans ASO3-1]|uniref:Metallophosphoesterase n=1 Tax=Desulfonatronospira thiodismutans ASO3-1 TaxID=555779 RepID=D6SLW5_9BACT|nr:metallophosphoesterase [Desulfonatronospira thiodismutans]EFI35676.1 metallophosphoesterase [Desulfonatronospira thiodismutans ASO3-1]
MTEKHWIAVGDIHENAVNLQRIRKISEARGILVSGDLTNVGGRSTARMLLDEIRKVNPNVYAQIGNMDTREVDRFLEESGVNVHNRIVLLEDDVYLLGLGYSTVTPFNTPSEVSDEQLEEWLLAHRDKASRIKHLIFMTHTPPYGTKTDMLNSGANVGSRAVREFIEDVQPEVCITGHVHEANIEDHVGGTKVINPGTLSGGGYVVIRYDGVGLDAHLKQVS